MCTKIRYLIVISGIAIVGCGDLSTDSTSNPYEYYNYVHFDTAQFVFSKYEYPPGPSNQVAEPAVNKENSLGEPFFDLNGNGIYEPGIDSFVCALDDSINQDKNRNNRYDGPEDGWEPGIPFDDLNGNGIYDGGAGSFAYFQGIPFCDFNGNGHRDTNLYAKYGFFRFKCERLEDRDFLCNVETFWDDRFEWVSDSGSTYTFYLPDPPLSVPLLLSDSGIGYLYGSHPLHVLDKGRIIEEEEEIQLDLGYGDPIVFEKTVLLNQVLTIDDVTYRNLVFVKFESTEIIREFYFSREHGLLAYGWNRYDGAGMYYGYFHKIIDRGDPPVLTMTR